MSHMPINIQDSPTGMNRRQFLRRTSAGIALFSLLPKTIVQGAEPISANEKVNVAGIGVGSQGGGDIDAVAGEGHNIVALCDVDDKYAAKKFAQYPKARQFKDFRVMLDEMGKEIDAVVIGTPDHTHAVIAMEAMSRGKHVYCEKPLAHIVHEVRALMAAASEIQGSDTTGQPGAFQRLDPPGCASGSGRAPSAKCIRCTPDVMPSRMCTARSATWTSSTSTYDVPKGLDYDLWIGPVPFRPYTPFWVHWNWRGWMPFGTGTIGDWFCHVMDPSFWALDLDAPTTVQAEVTDYDPAKHGLTYPPAARSRSSFPPERSAGRSKSSGTTATTGFPSPRNSRPRTRSRDRRHPLWGEGHDHARFARRRRVPSAAGHTDGPIFGQECARRRRFPRVKNHAWDWLEAIRTGARRVPISVMAAR